MLKSALAALATVIVGTGAMIFAVHRADRPAGIGEGISAKTTIRASADAAEDSHASATTLPAGHRFHHFESGHVRPLAMSANGQYVFAVNTPDNRLEVLRADRNRLTLIASVAVGMEPVAVAVNGNEAWVVNQLSDSVSVVDVTQPLAPFVKETILVGDEPRDVVFAGSTRKKAFITTARRGQNSTVDPKLTTNVGRALVWVFDTAAGASAGMSRAPLTVVELFTDTPRALAVSPDKKRVYAAGFQTGNKTTTATALVFPFFLPPPPFTNSDGRPQPFGGLIVKHDGQHWRDELGRDFDYAVYADLPDHDVFVIDAEAQMPAQLSGPQGVYSGVGTVIYGMTVNPVSGALYVMNTEALNEQRFEGPGEFAGHSVRGRHNLNRISILASGQVKPRHLNKHVDYSTCCVSTPNPESTLSVALPMLGDSSRDGSKLYVPFMGSSKVAVYNTAALEADTFVPRREQQITLSGGGPTGLVLDEKRGQLYVMTRFDNAVRVVDLDTQRETGVAKLFNPEPSAIVKGRRHLYDATRSAKGDSSCASCHTFGDQDSLAWDLGNPDASDEENANPFTVSTFNILGTPPDPTFSSMKGPMTTQSLRGMANHGPMHWRGDRTGAGEAPSIQPDSGAFDERAAFRKFQAGFTDLLGVKDGLTAAEIEEFTDFILPLRYPPNPIRNLDNSLTPEQAVGRDIFFNRPTTTLADASTTACNTCHRLDATANAQYGVEIPGFFGSDGRSSFVVGQELKVPHLRNLYTKIGRFGMPPFEPVFEPVPGVIGRQGPQVRGFGYTHSGDIDSVVHFLSVNGFAQNTLLGNFNPDGLPSGEAGLPLRRSIEAFLFAFDTDLKPVVGQQITITRRNASQTMARRTMLVEQARLGHCDLVARLPLGISQFGSDRGMPARPGAANFGTSIPLSFVYAEGRFLSNSRLIGTVPESALWHWASISDHPLTLTCVPPGSGIRIGIDRDSDGILDLDESRPFSGV